MNESTRTTSQTLSGLNFLFGLWLIISPYILNYTTTQAKWQQTVAGVIIAGLAIVRFSVPHIQWPSWINAIIGAWMIIAPFATGYQTASSHWNEVIFGALVLIVSLWNAGLGASTHVHHGHPAS